MVVRRTTARLRPRRAWTLAVPVLLFAWVLSSNGSGGASIPDGAGVIHACYTDDGRLRVIDTAEVTGTCKALETALSWNQAGPVGPAGPAGPPGADGVSAAFSYARQSSSVGAMAGATVVNIITQPVAAGSYVFLAKTEIISGQDELSECALTRDTGGGQVEIDRSTEAPAGNAFLGSRATHSLQRIGTGPATLRLNCFGTAGFTAEHASIIAIQVQNISETLVP